MKTSVSTITKLTLLTVSFPTASSFAKFEIWTNPEGKKLELELVSKKEIDSKLIGVFRARNGKTLEINQDKLSPESIDRIKAWTSEVKKSDSDSEANAYSELFDGNLLALSGKSLKKAKDLKTPAKYYVFYYTASWCGPCQRFTPSLVKFYTENKNDDFEIVLISSDRDEDSMNKYAKDKKMLWPHLDLKQTKKFKQQFPNKLGGIPAMLITDLDGKVIAEGGASSTLAKLEKLISE